MNLSEKSNHINSLLSDLKAEYIVSCLPEVGISLKDVLVTFDGPLKRKWSTDVDRCEIESFESGAESLNIHLNRAGIYDALPEALFHRFSENRNATGEEMAKDSMRLKTEEKQSRSFFRPFENELFHQAVTLSIKESLQFRSLTTDFLNGLVPGFWKVDENIPPKYASKLIKFLPLAHRIAGNYALSAHCLEHILGEKVVIEHKSEEQENPFVRSTEPGPKGNVLGRNKLGTDLVTGNKTTGFIGRLVVSVGPLKKTNPKDFFTNKPADRLLKCFYGYFVPVELDVETKFLIEETRRTFVLSDGKESEGTFLGLNTMLQ